MLARSQLCSFDKSEFVLLFKTRSGSAPRANSISVINRTHQLNGSISLIARMAENRDCDEVMTGRLGQFVIRG